MSESRESKKHPNEMLAHKAIEHARKIIPESGTHVGINNRDRYYLSEIAQRITEMRETYNEKISNPYPLEDESTLFEFETAIETISKVGNCGELSRFAFDYVIENNPEVNAEVFSLQNGSHELVVIGRDPNSNPEDPSTWGENAYFCDPLEKEVYSAKEYQAKLKAYVTAYKFQARDSENVVENFYVAGFSATSKRDLYDPSRWPSTAYVCDDQGRKIDSAVAYISKLQKQDKTIECVAARQFMLRAPFNPTDPNQTKHKLLPLIQSKNILQHRKVDNLFKNYNLKARVITDAVIGLINDFKNIMREFTGEKKDKNVLKVEKQALALLATIENIAADIKPKQSDTKTYRRVRPFLQTRLNTIANKAIQASRLPFFSKKVAKALPDKVKKALDTFKSEIKKLKP